MSTKVLHMIGKGQITIPQEWRALLGVNKGVMRATLAGVKIILEPISVLDEKSWRMEWISLNDLPKAEKKLIQEGRKAYRAGKKEKFITANEFFKNQD